IYLTHILCWVCIGLAVTGLLGVFVVGFIRDSFQGTVSHAVTKKSFSQSAERIAVANHAIDICKTPIVLAGPTRRCQKSIPVFWRLAFNYRNYLIVGFHQFSFANIWEIWRRILFSGRDYMRQYFQYYILLKYPSGRRSAVCKKNSYFRGGAISKDIGNFYQTAFDKHYIYHDPSTFGIYDGFCIRQRGSGSQLGDGRTALYKNSLPYQKTKPYQSSNNTDNCKTQVSPIENIISGVIGIGLVVGGSFCMFWCFPQRGNFTFLIVGICLCCAAVFFIDGEWINYAMVRNVFHVIDKK